MQAAEGVTCAYALEATTLLSGKLELVNRLHRWAVALELGIGFVPVKMVIEAEPVWDWESGMLS